MHPLNPVLFLCETIYCSIEALPQLDPAECVVMFPSEDALLPDQLPLEQLKHVILIDSKW